MLQGGREVYTFVTPAATIQPPVVIARFRVEVAKRGSGRVAEARIRSTAQTKLKLHTWAFSYTKQQQQHLHLSKVAIFTL